MNVMPFEVILTAGSNNMVDTDTRTSEVGPTIEPLFLSPSGQEVGPISDLFRSHIYVRLVTFCGIYDVLLGYNRNRSF
jgi:hypothetical protein